jgi:hypothetical protein
VAELNFVKLQKDICKKYELCKCRLASPPSSNCSSSFV